jgi:hypothetical protein
MRRIHVPATPVKPFHGYGGSLSGKRKNWPKKQQKDESRSKFRVFMQRTFGRPIFTRNKAM